MLPETVGETGRPAVVGGGASCSGTNWARPLPLSCTEGCCTIPGWVNPGMLSSSKSSSSSISWEEVVSVSFCLLKIGEKGFHLLE